MRSLLSRPLYLVAVVGAALASTGCGDDGGGARDTANSSADGIGAYEGDPELSPKEVVRAYVEALDERDGERFCELVAPYISGRYDLAARDPGGFLGRLDDCPGVVSAFIGYVEDCCPDRFEHAAVERILSAEPEGELRRVSARVRLDLYQMGTPGGPHTETIEDTVWLARLDGSWRVAKLSATAQAAALSDFRSSGEPELPGDDDPAAMPDVAAEQQRFAARVEEFRALLEEHEQSYAEPKEASECAGGASVSDPEGDQGWNGLSPGEPPSLRGGDLVGMDVAVDGDSVCVRWRLAGTPAKPLGLSYSHRAGPSTGFFQGFQVEIRPDGTAHVTSGEDDDGRPIPVPASVGTSGDAVSMVLTRESFLAGQREWTTHAEPPLDKFGFSANVVTPGPGRSGLLDALGTESSATYGYPDGALCPVEGC